MAQRYSSGSTATGHGAARGSTGSEHTSDPLAGLRRLQDEMGRNRRARKPGTPPAGVGGGSGSADTPGVPAGPGGPRRGRRGLHSAKRSVGRRLLRYGVVLLALCLVTVGGMYGYVRWRLGQIPSAHCGTCVAALPNQPFNVLIVGSDSRQGEPPGAAAHFGSASQVTGQRSDTIKILHVDPGSGSASLLSIPRDTFVTLSDMPPGTGLSNENKINTAFDSGPDPLIATIQNTLGIPINHFVLVGFEGEQSMVDALGGITLDFPYPVRDNDNGNNNSGLNIPTAGCQTLSGAGALELSRSRYYEYEIRPGVWRYDPTSDLGRIKRQNVIIEAIIAKAKSSLDNPFKINEFLGSAVHDITKDDAMSSSTLVALATKYHGFSSSALQTFTLPTTGGTNSWAGDVEIVQESAAQQMIGQFLGSAPPAAVTTPPLTQGGAPMQVPTTTTAPATSVPASGSSGVSGGSSAGTGSSGSSSAAGSAPPAQPPPPAFDPTLC